MHLFRIRSSALVTDSDLDSRSQALAASYRYDPFDNTISFGGVLAYANTYRFSSKECHTNSGMYYYLYRFYDPNLQRWMNRDPIEEGGGINLYAFSANDPVGENDPEGKGLLSAILRAFGFLNGIQNLISPPCLNGGTTPKQCTLITDMTLRGEHTCTYQCVGAHTTDEPLTAPPPTLTMVTIGKYDSCPADPDSPPIVHPTIGPAPVMDRGHGNQRRRSCAPHKATNPLPLWGRVRVGASSGRPRCDCRGRSGWRRASAGGACRATAGTSGHLPSSPRAAPHPRTW